MNEPGHAEVRDLIARGELLKAYDRASELLEQDDTDQTLRYLAALSLARAGAPTQAGAELAKLDADGTAVQGRPRLEEDIAALSARLVKDVALSLAGDDRRRMADEASGLY